MLLFYFTDEHRSAGGSWEEPVNAVRNAPLRRSQRLNSTLDTRLVLYTYLFLGYLLENIQNPYTGITFVIKVLYSFYFLVVLYYIDTVKA